MDGYTITQAFGAAVRGGQLDTIKWLIEWYGDRAKTLYSDPFDAPRSGHPDATKFLFDHPQHCSLSLTEGVEFAGKTGDLEMLQWLLAKAPKQKIIYTSLSYKLIDQADSNGHLHIVQWLHEHYPNECTENAMDLACAHGDLEVVRWLHANRTEGCTERAIDMAAADGHLDVVKWLDDIRTEGYTTNAMGDVAAHGHLEVVNAASLGHLDIVKWLHENRSEGCTEDTMDSAASCGYLNIVKFLHDNRGEGCMTRAMYYAVENGHFETILFLHANRTEGFGLNATNQEDDSCIEHLEIVQWLYANYPGFVDVDWGHPKTTLVITT